MFVFRAREWKKRGGRETDTLALLQSFQGKIRTAAPEESRGDGNEDGDEESDKGWYVLIVGAI